MERHPTTDLLDRLKATVLDEARRSRCNGRIIPSEWFVEVRK